MLFRSESPGSFSISARPCADSSCEKKMVSFNFKFDAPQEIRAVEFVPIEEFVYGGTILKVKVANLPPDLDASLISVEFVGLKSVPASSIQVGEDGLGVIHATIPRREQSGSIPLKVNLPGEITLDLDGAFSYKFPPAPVITSIIPSSVPENVASTVRIFLNNFPLSPTVESIKVNFQGTSFSAPGVVVAIASSSGSSQAIQTLEIDVQTPSNLQEGLSNVLVYNQRLGEIAGAFATNAVEIINPQSPQVKQMTTPSGMNSDGISQVPLSKTVVVEVVLENVPRQVDISSGSYAVQVANFDVMISNVQVFDNREAKVIFSTPIGITQPGMQYGIIGFGTSCPSDCCQDRSCSTKCNGIKVACFELIYFDDRGAYTEGHG